MHRIGTICRSLLLQLLLRNAGRDTAAQYIADTSVRYQEVLSAVE